MWREAHVTALQMSAMGSPRARGRGLCTNRMGSNALRWYLFGQAVADLDAQHNPPQQHPLHYRLPLLSNVAHKELVINTIVPCSGDVETDRSFGFQSMESLLFGGMRRGDRRWEG